mmetsp:Transcript_33206/g.69869  ORF Transcript_33206/g.69869 Transcript_33206/m.69869 type:complete len:201 (-) Transcript_33206:1696-2298(-)
MCVLHVPSCGAYECIACHAEGRESCCSCNCIKRSTPKCASTSNSCSTYASCRASDILASRPNRLFVAAACGQRSPQDPRNGGCQGQRVDTRSDPGRRQRQRARPPDGDQAERRRAVGAQSGGSHARVGTHASRAGGEARACEARCAWHTRPRTQGACRPVLQAVHASDGMAPTGPVVIPPSDLAATSRLPFRPAAAAAAH